MKLAISLCFIFAMSAVVYAAFEARGDHFGFAVMTCIILAAIKDAKEN